MDLESLRGFAYAFFTILFTLFLYAYIFSMYRKQKKGIVDYERYGYLALNDALEDELIEPRHKKAYGNNTKES
ncbi:cytochrome c oxidase, cbb3-type, CcoQ subunit [Helicobacter pylori]|uniref:cytochrome c oxidase, cbb3-type, CcoQ subunit n=1 Tax=Helicobacter pylori TaxID=210 RepID=UPI00192103B6|nr:cytochrome c oxidase, cbb3-type, CcoQ subunit [Helicobacter pylori]MCQ2755375.1 cytochrome c oxidase, cbb3-type, CcoQ subunit [Helicobacter pylori]QQW88824.1 cytochrome c oxidase, cbb3-type, CcoQ subunit [Helicobacter pylori]QQX47566.1 cytochrome c oxidase, cbb3-type, CcoQ subunit [Helicobacter pylori]WQW73895.1 cytochrome c oxidase, cbb3-type, CcoQ subunit [Helicobacter pylori]